MANTKSSSEKPTLVRDRFHRMRVTNSHFPTPEGAVTQQQFKDECDMNRIVKNAARGIAPSRFARGVANYGDFSEIPDVCEAYSIVQRAQEAFNTLPAELRLELNNDPTNVNKLTREQLERYKLLKQAPAPSQPAQSQPAASQAATPEVKGETPKGSKSSSKKEE